MKVITNFVLIVILLKICESFELLNWNLHKYFNTWFEEDKTEVPRSYENSNSYEIWPRENPVSNPHKRQRCDTSNIDTHLTTEQLITKHGYPAESHTVLTDDGYFLKLHRIPRSKNALFHSVHEKTVFLQHGLLGSSADWILTGPGKALAYMLSDAGYDVWMGNARGNTYSRAHMTLSPDSNSFWNFTWHEIGTLDLPASIDYINDLKKHSPIHYVGHSMGTTALFVLLSTRPEYNKILRAGIALAPIAYMSDVTFPGKMLASAAEAIENVIKISMGSEFLPNNFLSRWTLPRTCDLNEFDSSACTQTLNTVCSYEGRRFPQHLLPVILGHTPAGTSLKTLVHYAQQMVAKVRFQQFDYGTTINHRVYGDESPPEYPIQDISLPIALISSRDDEFGGLEDVQKLRQRLTSTIEHYSIPHGRFKHMDFIYAYDAHDFVYRKVLELMSRMDNSYYRLFYK